MSRPVVLVFVHYYLPGFKAGGPVRSIANLVDHLGDEFEFRVVTANHDLGDDAPYAGIKSGVWIPVGKAMVLYLDAGQRSIGGMHRLMRDTRHDLIYLNSFFEPFFSGVPLLLRRFGGTPHRPCVIAPRGEFSPHALALKAWKKRPYMSAIKSIGLARNVVWQASGTHEAADIARSFGVNVGRIRVAPNLPSKTVPVPLPAAPREHGSPLRVLFLSRISPMKNLHWALRLLARVREPVTFNIFGPVGDEEYWQRCQVEISTLPSHVHVAHHGVIAPERILETMAGHDLLFLPTLGENYGHVIAEALRAGTPVLISDMTPWRGLEAAGVGWDLPLQDEDGFLRAIAHCSRLEPGAWLDWRAAIRGYAELRLGDRTIVEANRALLRSALEDAPR